MDKNTIIGFLLMAAVLFGYTWFMQPSPEQKAAMQRYQDSLLQVENARLAEMQEVDTSVEVMTPPEDESVADARQMQLQREYVDFAPFAEGMERNITLSNPQLTLVFSTKGGRLTEAVLNDYRTYDSLPLTLFDATDNAYGFILDRKSVV